MYVNFLMDGCPEGKNYIIIHMNRGKIFLDISPQVLSRVIFLIYGLYKNIMYQTKQFNFIKNYF